MILFNPNKKAQTKVYIDGTHERFIKQPATKLITCIKHTI